MPSDVASNPSHAAMFVCELTPAGRGAVSTLEVAGDLSLIDQAPALFCAVNGHPISGQPVDRICFGRWGLDDAEEVVLCRTAADVVEVHCHGGRVAVARILRDLQARGARLETRSEHLARDCSPTAWECREALLQSATRRTASILSAQEKAWTRTLEELEACVSGGGEMPWPEWERRLSDSLQWTRFAQHLSRPWQVVLCGRPNVGKSSLINALLGYARSIVSELPGTTRDLVTAETALDGWPVQFSDTAGLRESDEEIETAGIERARQRIATADLKLLLLDASEAPQPEDHALLAEHPDALIVASKCDLTPRWTDLPADAAPVSSHTGEGVEELIARLVQRLVPALPEPTVPLPVGPRLEQGLSQLVEHCRHQDRQATGELCRTLLGRS